MVNSLGKSQLNEGVQPDTSINSSHVYTLMDPTAVIEDKLADIVRLC